MYKEKKILFHSSYGLWPFLEYELDIIQSHLNNGDTVYFVYCGGDNQACSANCLPSSEFDKSLLRCIECCSRVSSGIRWLDTNSGHLVPINLKKYSGFDRQAINLLLEKADQLDKNDSVLAHFINPEGFDLYEAAKSELISMYRDSNLSVTDFWPELRKLLHVSCTSFNAFNVLLRDLSPDVTYIFNGRLATYRPLVRLCERLGFEFFVYEYPGYGYENFTLCHNSYPHNLKWATSQLKNCFDSLSFSQTRVISEGSLWFENRLSRSSLKSDPYLSKSFDSIIPLALPDDWDKSQFNLAFFVSSPDEQCTIPEYIDFLPFYQDEFPGFILAHFPMIKLTIRVHPNLLDSNPLFIEKLYSYESHPMVSVVPADGQVDSYALVQQSDLIVCFASTVGAEAAYLKKPVICIGPSGYEFFDCVSTVTSVNHLFSCIKDALNGNFASFPPPEQRRLGACQFACAFMHQGVKPRFLRRSTFSGGVLVRNGSRTSIKAVFLLRLINKMLSFLYRFSLIRPFVACF